MIAGSIEELDENAQFVRIKNSFPKHDVYVKLEGLNTAGSVKLKTAIALVDSLEELHGLQPGGWVIESSSGSLGIALSAVCARRGYKLTIVTDLNANARSIAHMRALGAEVEIVQSLDTAGGFLGTRLARVRELVEMPGGPLWTNQYENVANPEVHSKKTYRAIVEELGDPDYLFVGAGTTGTLMGVSRAVMKRGSCTKVCAIDSTGSVTFGGAPSRRYIPGLGASVKPPIFDEKFPLKRYYIDEIDTVRQCRRIAQVEGFLPGGSTGTVLAAFDALRDKIPEGSRVVIIAPDLGERYLDGVYNDDWVMENFGESAFNYAIRPVAHEVKETEGI